MQRHAAAFWEKLQAEGQVRKFGNFWTPRHFIPSQFSFGIRRRRGTKISSLRDARDVAVRRVPGSTRRGVLQSEQRKLYDIIHIIAVPNVEAQNLTTGL